MNRRWNRRTVRVVEPAVGLAVPVEDLRAYLALPDEVEDVLILQQFIRAATEWAKDHLGRSLLTETLETTMDGFPSESWGEARMIALGPGTHDAYIGDFLGRGDEFDLPYPPAQEVLSIISTRRNGTEETFPADRYYLDAPGARVALYEGWTWPLDLRDRAAVRVTWRAGFGGPDDIPQPIRFGIMHYAAAMYEHRGGCEVPEPALAAFAGWRLGDRFGAW